MQSFTLYLNPSKLTQFAAVLLATTSAQATAPFELAAPVKHSSEAPISTWHQSQQLAKRSPQSISTTSPATSPSKTPRRAKSAIASRGAQARNTASRPEDWFKPAIQGNGGAAAETQQQELQLRGVILQGQQPMALINERWLAVGQQIGNATIQTISANRVTLRRDGKKQKLTLVKDPVATAQSIPNPATEWMLEQRLNSEANATGNYAFVAGDIDNRLK